VSRSKRHVKQLMSYKRHESSSNEINELEWSFLHAE
jgi:hypothetical protein